MAKQSGGVFISYRHEDSAYALLMYDRLIKKFGPERVFRDREGIAPAENFVARIDDRIAHAHVVVAVIGRGWIQRRPGLSKRSDFVRRELLLALKKHVKLLPVLVGDAKMPTRTELPPSLREFALINAIPITDYRFDADFTNVVTALEMNLVPASPSESDTAGTDMLMAKVDELQIQAVGMIDKGDLIGAQRMLNEGWDLIMSLRKSAPGSSLDVRFGYVCKTLAQAFQASGDAAEADRYIGLAATSFSQLESLGATGAISVDLLAGAVNGLGNVHSFRNESDEAIACYQRAVAIMPDYAYAWHDLLLEYLNRANKGHVELAAMSKALAELKRTGINVPDIGPQRIELFEGELKRVEITSSRTIRSDAG